MTDDDTACCTSELQRHEPRDRYGRRVDRLAPMRAEAAMALAVATTSLFVLIVILVEGDHAPVRSAAMAQIAGGMAGTAGLTDLLAAAMLTLAGQAPGLARDLATCGCAFLIIAVPLLIDAAAIQSP